MRIPDRERGAALLTVLLLVAVIAVMAGAALEKLRISTRLAGNAAAIEQSRAYSYAAETLAVKKVNDLLGQSPDRINLAGGWSGKPFGLPLPGGGVATASVRDGGNCFNLNGLVTKAEAGYANFTPARLQFVALMKLLAIPGQTAEGISAAAADWIDADQSALTQGAEDATYLARDPRYRTAGTLMADPSELRAVAGVTPEIYATLRPWVCTLPQAAPSPIDVNTLAPEQAPLVAMLQPETLTVAAVRQALLKRPVQGYDTVESFTNAMSLGGGTSGFGASGQLAVTSKWFALDVNVSLGGTEIEQRSLIDATHLPARLVSRQWGERT